MTLCDEDLTDVLAAGPQHAAAAPVVAAGGRMGPTRARAPDGHEVESTAGDELPEPPRREVAGAPLGRALRTARLRRVEPDQADQLAPDPDRVAVQTVMRSLEIGAAIAWDQERRASKKARRIMRGSL